MMLMGRLRGTGFLILTRISFLLVFFVGMCRKDLIGIFVDLELRSASCDFGIVIFLIL